MTKNVTIAVVGAGVIGKRHIDAISQVGSAELCAVVDTAPHASEVAAASGVPVFDDVAAMADAIRPDAVIVSTPTIHHLAPTLLSLEAGAHVLVEKPITATLDEAQAIIDKERETGRHVLVGHQRRYYTLVEKARELVRGGELGRLIGVNGQWTVKKDDEYYSPQWRKERAAGPVLTNLIHEIDYLRYICGDIESVSAQCSRDIKNFEKEDTAALVLRFSNGALGTFLLSDQMPTPWAWELGTGENPLFPPTGENCVRFMGTRASLDFPNLKLWKHETEVNSWDQQIHGTSISMPFEQAYVEQCKHLVEVVRGNAKPRIDAQDGTRTLKATLAVLESADTGNRIDL